MASWTDNPAQFNPYVQQLPVEAMVAVGTEKQRRYDEGVQRIQSSIDRIAGLDIARDVDKQYLQNKLTDLGDKLKFVAAGDFSDYQLVNAVTGMTSKVGKDENIQNAVISTARYRSELEKMEAARKEGKSAVQNEWDFITKASNWLNDPNVGASFNERYTPYIDVDKKWFEVLKTLHTDLREEDIPYAYKEDGTIDYSTTANAMQRISKEVLSADKIENALRASLSPDERNQLSINGRYDFRGIDGQNLTLHATSKYRGLMDENNEIIQSLKGVDGLASDDPTIKFLARQTIDSLISKNQRLGKQLNEELELINLDPENAKVRIYTNGAISQFAAAHSWEHNKSNILTNPLKQQENWEKNFKITEAKLAIDIDAHNWDKFMDQQRLQMDQLEFQLKQEKFNLEMYGTSNIDSYLNLPTKTDAIKAPIKAITNDISALTGESDAIILDMAGKIGASEVQVRNAIERYKGGDKDWYQERGKDVIPVEWRDNIDRVVENQLKAKRKGIVLERSTEEAKRDINYDNRKREILTGVQGEEGMSVVDPSGKTVYFSPEEIATYISKRDLSESIINAGGSPGGVISNIVVQYTRPLTEKEQLLASGSYVTSSRDATNFNRIFKRVSSEMSKLEKELTNGINQKILESNGEYTPRLVGVTFSEAEGGIARNTWETYASQALSYFNKKLTGMKGGSEYITKGEVSKAMGWLDTDKSKIIYKKLTQGDKTFLVMMKGNEEPVVIPLTSDLAPQMPLVDPKEPSSLYKDIVSAQNASRKGTTNMTGNYEDAYFWPNKYMPNVDRLNVKADLSSNMANSGKQYVNLILRTEQGVFPLKIDKPLSREAALSLIQGLTDNQIKQLYLESNKISESWKEIIRNL